MGNPNRNLRPPAWVISILVTVGLFILVIFIVDKLLFAPAPQSTSELAAAIVHLQRHEVRRVTIPASSITFELNDGKRVTLNVPSDRDLWPLIRTSGADVALMNAKPVSDETPLLGYASQFVPFVIMGLLLIFILRTVRRSSR